MLVVITLQACLPNPKINVTTSKYANHITTTTLNGAKGCVRVLVIKCIMVLWILS